MNKPNIVFVTVDCLRQDHVNSELAETPFLDSLAEKGLNFTEMHATTTTTTPSVASLMTGTYSERNGVNSLKQVELEDNVETLAEKLSENGYHTQAEVTGPLVEKTGLDRGFDSFNYRDKDEDLFSHWKKQMREKLEDFDEPFFLYLHLWEIHGSIEVPEDFRAEEYGENRYQRALSALDRKLEELLDDLPENTVVAVHGDHGESVSWYDSFLQEKVKQLRTLFRYYLNLDTRKIEELVNRIAERFSPTGYRDHFMEMEHGENVYDFTTNVPFILKGPGIEPEKVDEQVRQIDVFPTLLDLLDIKHGKIDGETLLNEKLESRKAYMRACGASLGSENHWKRAVRKDGWKYVEYPNKDWNPELYNLEEDPYELRSLENREKRDELREELPDKELLKSEELEIKDKLKDLGYG